MEEQRTEIGRNDKSPDLYGRIFNSLNIGVFLYKTNKKEMQFINANQFGCELFHFENEQALVAHNWTLPEVCHPDEEDYLLHELLQMNQVGDQVDHEYHLNRHDGTYVWVQCHQSVMDVQGDWLTILNSCTVIDKEKQALRQLETEMQKTNIALEHADIILWEYDVKRHRTIQQTKAIRDFNAPVEIDAPYGLIREGFVFEESAQAYIDLHKAVDAGAPVASADIALRDADGSKIYKRETYYTIFEDGEPVRAIGVASDITQEMDYASHQKIYQQMVERIVDFGFEFLGLLYSDGTLNCIRPAMLEETMQCGESLPYDEGYRRFVQLFVPEETQAEALKALDEEYIRAQLNEHGRYTCAFAVQVNGVTFHKKWEFSYLDDSNQTVIFARSDVTEITRQQEEQRETLRLALKQAQQANEAKTVFLSRMSHEIRTPMNAIIGMSALAAQCVNKPDEVSDCISKVGLSARYLLSLINDILDMSRIESGKMELRREEIPFESFINGINTICYERATEKEIDYDCVIATYTQEAYIGDAMKLQQVLVNLLGNAIKFTPAGGKVQLIIAQEGVKNGKAHMKFAVTDTGIGISEEFLPKMFEAFEQEDNGITSQYTGTGLGLAISKNLVSMMGGTIHVTSIPNVGSEFTVELDMEVCKSDVVTTPHTLLLDHLRALVVDDDVIICQHTQSTLENMGIKAEWVDSGMQAVEQVCKEWEQDRSYDVIFVDWKMPDMDGIETARRIREIVGPDVTIIIMTAYDWASIEAKAKAVGVNLLISKPLFKSSLMSAFQKVYAEKQQVSKPVQSVQYDFSGRRILLVEDNALNREVAKRLLKSKGVEVEEAENGLAAIEMVTTAEVHYYDLVVMDIRMPVMDGLTAARSIRHLKKEGAKDIPIVAMSANAFQEDIDKSKAAGINVHLSKPIEPKEFFETIQNLLPQD